MKLSPSRFQKVALWLPQFPMDCGSTQRQRNDRLALCSRLLCHSPDENTVPCHSEAKMVQQHHSHRQGQFHRQTHVIWLYALSPPWKHTGQEARRDPASAGHTSKHQVQTSVWGVIGLLMNVALTEEVNEEAAECVVCIASWGGCIGGR